MFVFSLGKTSQPLCCWLNFLPQSSGGRSIWTFIWMKSKGFSQIFAQVKVCKSCQGCESVISVLLSSVKYSDVQTITAVGYSRLRSLQLLFIVVKMHRQQNLWSIPITDVIFCLFFVFVIRNFQRRQENSIVMSCSLLQNNSSIITGSNNTKKHKYNTISATAIEEKTCHLLDTDISQYEQILADTSVCLIFQCLCNWQFNPQLHTYRIL